MKKILLILLLITVVFLVKPFTCFGLSGGYPQEIKIITINGSVNTDTTKPLHNLCDGDSTTLWSTTGTSPSEAWFELWLTEPVIMDYIEIAGAIPGSADDVSIYYVDANNLWQPFLGHKHIQLKNGRIDLSWNRAMTDRLRFVFHNSSNSTLLGNIGELRVFGHTIEDLVCLAGKITTNCEDLDYQAKFLSDKNTYTVWKAPLNTDSASITITYPMDLNIKRVKYFNRGGMGTLSFSALVNNNWTSFGSAINLATLPKGWQIIEVNSLIAKAIKLDVTSNGSSQIGGIAEVEVWGTVGVESKKILQLTGNVTGATAVGFNLDEKSTWDETELWLTLPVGATNSISDISINGNTLSTNITLISVENCVLAKIPLDSTQLIDGHNIINLNLGSIIAEDVVLVLSRNIGCLSILNIQSTPNNLIGLFDGNRYTTDNLSIGFLDIELTSAANIDAIQLYSNTLTTLSNAYISVWNDSAWESIDPAKVQVDGMIIRIIGGINSIGKVRLQLTPQEAALLTEVEVIGSPVNDNNPTVFITAPLSQNLNAGSCVNIEGFVDNAVSLTVNGTYAIIQGYSFSCPIYINSSSSSTYKVTAIATDILGRTGQVEKIYIINQSPANPLPTLTCDLSQNYCTANNQVIIQGSVTNTQTVKVNSNTANLSTGRYSSMVSLKEGANKISIEAFSDSGAITRLERTIILDTQAPVLIISDQTVSSDNLTIKGSCIDTTLIELRINNGIIPIINDGFSYTLQLVSGINTVYIVAKDSLGHESTVTISKNISSDVLFYSESVQGSSSNELSNLDLASMYAVPNITKENDTNPYQNEFENCKETVSPASGGLNVEVSDIVLPGRNEFNLEIKRIYNSHQSQTDAIYGVSNTKRSIPVDMFGDGWSLNIPWIEQITQTNGKTFKNIHLPDGQTIKIDSNVKEYHDGGIHFSLDQNQNYTLTINDGTQYCLDNNGKVVSKSSPDGKTQLLFSYNGREINQIAYSVDSLNRVAKFSYQTIGSKRVISMIKIGERTISYQYNSNGLLWKVISPWENIDNPRNRKTEYIYTPYLGLTFGSTYYQEHYRTFRRWDDFFQKYVWDGEWVVVANYNWTTTYNLFLLQSIKYPTGGTSSYTYVRKNQNCERRKTHTNNGDPIFFSFAGDQFLVSEQNARGKVTTFNYNLNDFLGSWPVIAYKNSYIYWTEVTEAGKTIHYNYEQLVKFLYQGKFIYNITSIPIRFYPNLNYVGPILTSSKILVNNFELEQTLLQYDLQLQAVTLEQHFRDGKNIYEINNQYDAWGNITSTKDNRIGLEKIINYHNHPIIKNLPETVKVNNLNGNTGVISTVTTTYVYDDTLGKPKAITIKDGKRDLTTRCTYYQNGNLWTQTQPNNLVTEIIYDDNSIFPKKKILHGLTDAENNALADIETRVDYNFYGLKDWEMNPLGYVTIYCHDEFNRLTKVFLPEDNDLKFQEPIPGQEPVNHPYREYQFNDQNNFCDFWNANRQKTRYCYDSFGKLTATITYDNSSGNVKEIKTSYHYDNQNRLSSLVDPRGNVTSIKDAYITLYDYDSLGRIIKITFPSESGDKSVSAILEYDDLNNITTLTQENGNIVTEQKDWAERLKKVVKSCQFEGANQSFAWNITYDSMGNITKQINPMGEYIYNYDALGHLENITKPRIPVVLPNAVDKQVYMDPYPLNPTITYRYEDELGNRTAEISANANSIDHTSNIEYKYDQLGRLVSTTNKYAKFDLSTYQIVPQLATTYYFYDSAGNKVRMKDANGGDWYYSYSANGFLLSEQDPQGNITRYRYDPIGNKIASIDPRNKENAPTIWYSFDANKKLVINDPRTDKNFTTWYIYDDENRLIRTVFPDNTPPDEPYAAVSLYDNPFTETNYDLVGNKVNEKDANGFVTNYVYTARNWLISVSDQQGIKEWYEYDKCGHQTFTHTRISEGIYSVTKKDYDSLGQLRRITSPNLEKEEYQYDALGNKTSIIDGNLHTTYFKYNDLGWLTEVKDPLENITQYRYDPNGNQVAIIAPNNMLTINRYDEQNHVIEQIDSLNQSVKYTYDLVGNRKEILDRRYTKWVYNYFSNNLLQQVTLTGVDNSNYSINYEYDPVGNRTKVSDDSSIHNIIIYNDQVPDPLNRINSIQKQFDNQNYRTEYNYNKNSQLSAIKYPEAIHKIFYNYNSLNQLVEIQGFTRPDGIYYSRDDLVQSFVLMNGISTNFSYDTNRRLQDTKTYLGSTDILKYHYNYDSIGNITSIHDGVFNKDSIYSYFDNNWLKSAKIAMTPFLEKQSTPGTAGFITGDYLSNGKFDFTTDQKAIISLDTNASSIGLSFGTLAPAIKKIQLIPGGAYQNHRVSDIMLDLYISNDNNTYQGISHSDWSYGSDNGIVTITFKNVQSARYLKIHVKVDERDAEYVSINQAEFLNELGKTLRVYQEATSQTEEYHYDMNGNRNELTFTQVQTVFYGADQITYYSNSNRLKSDGKYAYKYDQAGNLVRKGNKYFIDGDNVNFITTGEGTEYWRYKYDLLNRLIQVIKNNTIVAEYGYDPEGLRVVKRTQGVTTHYIFNNDQPIFEKRISDGRIRSYVYAFGKHLARVDGVIGDTTAPVYYYHTDHLGTIKGVTDRDGNVVFNANYSPFGSRWEKNGSYDEDVGFTGKEFDSDTGLYYFNARWYDPETGRFISEDPIQDEWIKKYFNQSSNDQLNQFMIDHSFSQRLNWYLYCINNRVPRQGAHS